MDEFTNYFPWTPERLARIDVKQLEVLLAPGPGIPQDQSEPITNLAIKLSQLQGRPLKLNRFLGRQALLKWYKTKAYSIYNLESFFSCLEHRFKLIPDSKQKDGFNLIGYSRGTLGLGEDLRATAALLRNRGIPFSVYHIGHPSDSPEECVMPEESAELLFNTSVLFLNTIEAKKFLSLYQEYLPYLGYKIIIPPWELPEAPAQWESVFAEFDEIWCMSDFVAKAYEGLHNNLISVPPVVLPPAKSGQADKRQQRGFTYLYIFDAGSYLTRKNPEAVVKSFLQAFASSNEPVRLVLKVSNWQVNSQTMALESLIKLDSRISLITENYSSDEMNTLWDSCSCYVSLHRSEGFGRTIAEAACRGIPIVCTGWSGNVDITGQDYPLLVDYQLKAVEEGDYPHFSGQYWADVDVNDGAAKLHWVSTNRNTSELATITAALQQRFETCFSLQSPGRRIESLYSAITKSKS